MQSMSTCRSQLPEALFPGLIGRVPDASRLIEKRWCGEDEEDEEESILILLSANSIVTCARRLGSPADSISHPLASLSVSYRVRSNCQRSEMKRTLLVPAWAWRSLIIWQGKRAIFLLFTLCSSQGLGNGVVNTVAHCETDMETV